MKLYRLPHNIVAVFNKSTKKITQSENRARRMLRKKHRRNEPVINSILQRSIK